MSQEAFRGEKFRRLDIDINRESEQNLALRTLVKETVGKKRRRVSDACYKDEIVLCESFSRELQNLPLEELGSSNSFVVLGALHGLPRVEHVGDVGVAEFLDHGNCLLCFAC